VIVQRVLPRVMRGTPRRERFCRFLKILPVFMLVLLGIIAFALFPDQVKNPISLTPRWSSISYRSASLALVMAALLAAVMGAMSSVFNSASRS